VPIYAYKGISASGKAARGHLDAESSRSARAKLRRDGIFVTDMSEAEREAAPRPGAGRFALHVPNPFRRVSGLDLALLTRQAATLVGEISQALLELVDEQPDAIGLLRGRTFASVLH